MNGAGLLDDPLRPRSPGGNGLGLALALLVHLGLVVALAVAVKWHASEPQGLSAELWAAVPQSAAPPEQPPPPPAPTPAPPPAPKPEPRVEPPPAQPDAQIAIEKARKEQLEKQRLEKEKAERLKVEKEQAELKRKQELEAQRKQEFEAQRKQKADEERIAKVTEQARQDQLKRMQGLAGATGGPTSTGSATRDAGPSSSYTGRVIARVKPNIVFSDELSTNPTAEVEVRAAPDGTIIGRKLIKSSGSREWDDAVLRAIDRTETLPRDVDGRVPSPIVIAFRPRER
jgi:colicin import membrane protein